MFFDFSSYEYDKLDILISDNIFENNEAKYAGGVIYLDIENTDYCDDLGFNIYDNEYHNNNAEYGEIEASSVCHIDINNNYYENHSYHKINFQFLKCS